MSRSRTAVELLAAYALLLALVWRVAERRSALLGLALVFVVLAAWWRRGTTLRDLGLVPSQWRSGWTGLAKVSLLGVAGLVVAGVVAGTASLTAARFGWLSDYALGIVGQQVLLQGFFAPGFAAVVRPGRSREVIATGATALAFAGLHAPNPGLVIGTAIASAFWVTQFRRHHNLPAVLASHLVLGTAAMASFGPGPLWNLRVGAGALDLLGR